MPLLSLPPELLRKIVAYSTPPLPVPTSTTSFLEELQLARGDFEGEWKDIGQLMLVCKAIKVRGTVQTCASSAEADGSCSDSGRALLLVASRGHVFR